MKHDINQHGFTLVELLVTVAIVGIMLSIAGPSFVDLIRSTRISSTMNQLVSDLHAAKGEAIKRNARVLVCAKNASANTCSAGTDWKDGWLVCFDVNADGGCDTSTESAPNPLVVRNAIPGSLTLTGTLAAVQFTSTGTAVAAATYTLRGTWTTDAPTKTAAVALTGFVRTY